MSMIEEDFGSDTDDDDYVPEGEFNQASEEENSGDDENGCIDQNMSVTKGVRKNKAKTDRKPNMRISMFQSEEEKVDFNEEEQNKNEEKEKKKANDLWADFKKDTSTNVKKTVSKPKSSAGFSSLFSDSLNTSNVKNRDSSKTFSSTSRSASLFDVNTTDKQTTVSSVSKSKPKNSFSDLFEDTSKSTEDSSSNQIGKNLVTNGKIEITKVYDYAGEEVKISKTVDAGSVEASKFLNSSKRPASGGAGLAGIVGSLEKKSKIGCLDKSKMDWNSFVEENAIREELTTFNKGKDGYVEKQQFLERTDLRQFELEKAVRDKNRKSLMK